MENVEINDIIEFLKQTQILFTVAMIVVSAVSSFIGVLFTNKSNRKMKSLEVFFQNQLSSYQNYLNALFSLTALMRANGKLQTIYDSQEIKSHIIDTVIPAQATAMLFASKKLFGLLEESDAVLARIVQEKDPDEYISLIHVQDANMTKLIHEMHAELASMK